MSSLTYEIDTICAISSPAGEGAISIIRASGTDCLHILRKIFKPYRKDFSNIKPRFLYTGLNRKIMYPEYKRCVSELYGH